jgi:hypothetical protein
MMVSPVQGFSVFRRPEMLQLATVKAGSDQQGILACNSPLTISDSEGPTSTGAGSDDAIAPKAIVLLKNIHDL